MNKLLCDSIVSFFYFFTIDLFEIFYKQSFFSNMTISSQVILVELAYFLLLRFFTIYSIKKSFIQK